MLPENRPPVHPGEVLKLEFLEPLGMTQRQLAEKMHVPYQRVNELVNGRRGITLSTALRLARLFGTTPEFWLNLQRQHEMWRVHRQEAEVLAKIHPVCAKSFWQTP